MGFQERQFRRYHVMTGEEPGRLVLEDTSAVRGGVMIERNGLIHNMKMGRKPREGILCSLPCLVPRVRAMSEAQPKGSSNLSSRCAMKVLMKRSGSLALATP